MNTESSNDTESTESKVALVPVAQKTQEIATALWQKPSVRYGVIPGLVVAAVGIGAWAHWRQAKATNPEGQEPSSESES
jgi:hypothetical protein